MEIDVTTVVNLIDNPAEFSDSIANSGLQNIGEVTWRNALNFMSDAHNLLVTTEKELEHARDHFRQYGAWDCAEIASWDCIELNAMLVQEIASDLQNQDANDDIDTWEGTDRLYHDIENNKWFLYLGM